MDVYDYIGIPRQRLNRDIPAEMIVQFTDPADRAGAKMLLQNVRRITLIYSFERNNRYLQVINVELNKPTAIARVSHLIQKAIRYRVLFVFDFEERYLLLWRKFKLSKNEQRVLSSHIIYSTHWIYSEELTGEEYDFFADSQEDTEYYDVDEEEGYETPLYESATDDDDGDTVYFQNELSNVVQMNRSSINSDRICARALVDWLEKQSPGLRSSLKRIIEYMSEHDDVGASQIADENVFLCTSAIENAICSVKNWKFLPSVGRQGRSPAMFFENMDKFATGKDVDEVRDMIRKCYLKSLYDDETEF